ncbi:hypothetical protein E4U58_006457 [Claviceps cyperi]|nr:hypothetical protein E4U58_006457 [Claviceps cyperi]
MDRRRRLHRVCRVGPKSKGLGRCNRRKHTSKLWRTDPESACEDRCGRRPTSRGSNLLIWPNDHEILILDLHHGTILTRLRGPLSAGPSTSLSLSNSTRITTIAWRSHGGGTSPNGRAGMGGNNSLGAIYSAHADGQIRAWMPQVPGSDDVAEVNPVEGPDEKKSRKRKAVDSAYRSLMRREITFTGDMGR